MAYEQVLHILFEIIFSRYRSQMGPAATKAHPPTSNQHPDQTLVSHPRLQNAKVVSKSTEQQEGVVEVSVALPAESQFSKWEKKVAELGQLQSVYLPVAQRYQKTEFCGSGGIAWIQFKNYPYLLSDEINNRRNMESKHFEQPELWYLLYSIISAADSFHSRAAKLGDARPQNVFISHSGHVRVACQLTWPNEQPNYLKTVFEKETTYLAPEELKDINYGKLDSSGAAACLSQSFSVGLTCFDAALLSNSTELYLQGNKFHYELLERQFAALEQARVYSEPLLLLLKGLCQVEPSKRATCRQAAAWLHKYDQFINQLQQFKFQQIPDKLLALRLIPKSSNNAHPQHYVPPPQTYSFPRQSLQRPKVVPVAVPQQVHYSGNIPLQNPASDAVLKNPSFPRAGHTVSQGANGVNGGNLNPSTMTFQKDPRPAVLESGYPQPRIKLDQIDQQLQLSRKMFPN